MRRLLPLLAAALAGAALLALAGVLTAPEAPEAPAKPPARWTAPDRAFSIATPTGWRVAADGPGGTVLRREDGRGHVVIRRRGAVREPYAALSRRLTARLRASLKDFQPAGARTTRVGAGTGLVYTFVRPRANTVHSIVVAPAGARAYTLDLVAPGDAPAVARELGGMVRSFTPRAQA